MTLATRLRTFTLERRGRFSAAIVLLIAVWALLPLLPRSLGLSFGVAYQLFFSAFVVAALLFFELLRTPTASSANADAPRAWRVLSGIVLVYGITVGGLVGIGSLYPQFEVPRLKPGQTALSPEERGKAIFWDRTVSCFACHAIEGKGGKRAPDLFGVSQRAATRKNDVAADEYIRQHIKQGSTYFTVPGYQPIMPPFGASLPTAQVEDLVAYLLSLK